MLKCLICHNNASHMLASESERGPVGHLEEFHDLDCDFSWKIDEKGFFAIEDLSSFRLQP